MIQMYVELREKLEAFEKAHAPALVQIADELVTIEGVDIGSLWGHHSVLLMLVGGITYLFICFRSRIS